VAAGNGAGQVAIWDLEGNQPPRLLEHPESPFRVSQLVWSRAAERLAVVPWDFHDVFVYAPDAWQLIHRLPTDNHGVAAFSPDGKVLAADSKLSILLFDVASGHKTGELIGHSSTIYALDFHADGKLLASASGDRTMRLWPLSGSQHEEMRHTGAAMDVDFVPEGNTVVSVDTDGIVKLGRAPTQSKVCDLPSLGRSLKYVAASPDKRRLAVIDEDGDLIVLGVSPRSDSLYPDAP
jgi:WD40 repeat protein